MSLTFNAVNHIAGPAIATFDSQVWYTEGDIEVDLTQDEWDVNTSLFGVIDRRIKSLPVGRVTFQPDGQLTTAKMGKAFPYDHNDIGKSIFTSSDKTLVIHTLAGQTYTFQKAALAQLPGLHLSAQNTAFTGQVQFMCLSKSNTDVTAAESFVTIASLAFSDVSFDETDVLSPGYTAAYGESPFDAMESVDGFKIELPITVQPKMVDRLGTVDAYLTSIGPAVCRFTPAGMTEANWKTLTHLDGTSVLLPGVSGSSGSADLVISGSGLSVTLPSANVVASKLGYGTSKDRLGELMFHNRVLFSTGVPAGLLTIAVG